MKRHFDFQRIYDEFCSYYKNVGLGETEYYGWLRALKLDEDNCYGAARESFQWAKGMLNFLKEDAENKYYGIIVGLPITSMNGNVYKERDLIAAALSLKDKHPSLNHKKQFWFNENSRWGTLTVIDAKYEDGAVEAILKVPKSAVCPICKGAPMYELIDKQHIVNVSLEGTLEGAFEFTDPPFTLLTTSVLPGIPLARIKPLEKIVAEALQSSIKRGKRKENLKKKVIKLVPKRREDKEPGQMGMERPPTTGSDSMDTSVYNTPDLGTGTGPTGANKFRGNLTPVSQQTDVPVGTDSAAAKPEGVWTTSQPNTGDTTPHESTTGTILHVKPTDQPTLITSTPPMPEVDSHQGPSKTGNISPDLTKTVLPGGDSTEPKPTMQPTAPATVTPDPPHACSIGHHWVDGAGCVPDVDEPTHDVLPSEQVDEPCADGYHKDEEGKCVPDTDLEEKIRRFKAEDKSRSNEKKALLWEQRYGKLAYSLSSLSGRYNELKQVLARENQKKEFAIRDMHNSQVERDRYSRLRDEAAGERDETRISLEQLQRTYKIIEHKYNESMKTNLALSMKVTKSNEEYLDIAKQRETLQEKLQKARNLSKKVVRLKI